MVLANIKKNKIFTSFFKRSILLASILIIEALILGLVIDFQFTSLNGFFIYTPLHFVLFLFILTFFIVSIKELIKIDKIEKLRIGQFLIFLSINLIAFFTFYRLNSFFMYRFDLAAQNPIFYSFLWYINGIIMVIALVFAFFEVSFIKQFVNKFKKHFLTAGILSFVFHFLLNYSTRLWPYFARYVGKIVYFLLNIFFDSVTYTLTNRNLPVIRIEGFSASIAAPCSGIEGMGLFLFLFVALILIEYKNINLKKAAILLPLGIVGAFFVNIFRTFSLYVIGHLFSARFAVGGFHSNAGWILFTAYFLVFIYFGYPWMRKR